jgi:large subunit ribosomal protein L9
MNMKLILRADVEHLGRLGDIVEVKPGYGRNCLLPKGLAMKATTSNLKLFESERNRLEANVQSLRTSAQSLAERINDTTVTITVRVGEGDKLYGSVTTVMLAEELEKLGLEIDRRRIVLDLPIRALGEYSVPVKLHQDVKSELKVCVVGRDSGQSESKQEPEVEAETEA